MNSPHVHANKNADVGENKMSLHPLSATSTVMLDLVDSSNEECTRIKGGGTVEIAESRFTSNIENKETGSLFENSSIPTVNSKRFENCTEQNISAYNKTTVYEDTCKSELSQKLKESESKLIYGEASGGGISFIGSWALQSCSDLAGMRSKPELSAGGKDGVPKREERSSYLSYFIRNSSSSLPTQRGNEGSNTSRPWKFEAGTVFEMRFSHFLKVFVVWALVMALASIIFHSRIRSLETERDDLNTEVSLLKAQLNRLNDRMDALIENYPPKSSFVRDNGEDEMEKKEDFVGRSKRSPHSTPGRGPKDIQYSTRRGSHNELYNGTVFGSEMGGWSANGNSKKGKRAKNIRKNIRRQIRKEVKNIKTANKVQFNILRQELRDFQQQQRHIINASCCVKISSHDLSNAPIDTSFAQKRTRAAYLQIDGLSLNIKKPKQVIGPWYLDAKDKMGFNGGWYENLSLDSNGTSIIFLEDGLFLIYAQVFYQLQQIHNVNPNPMGYRIHLRKSTFDTKRKPITIAECVPSFPTTLYQTCFTQVAWYVEAQDEIYMEHFTDSKPMIEALRMGQTFLGIVQLS